jgi:alkanesulfonate monooxygenase SsuD/methylene tetrahydromethanopterin reductase-like flavin-dependent oxidoreductase (luciferase family)
VEGAAPLPDYYWRTHDQFVALAAAAAVTSTIRLGTGITLVAQRDPIWLAKQVASLDVVSDGRILFGIGYGWNKEEMAHHGTAYLERRPSTVTMCNSSRRGLGPNRSSSRTLR